jgi:AraC-like DNA-binding protein
MPFYRTWDGLDPHKDGRFYPDDVPRDVAAFGADLFTKGVELGFHSHRKAQLLLTLRGIVTCEADQGVWIVPPNCAVWIPAGMPHSLAIAGNIEVYCLFVEPNAAGALPRECSTLAVSPLLKHLLLQVSQMPELYDVDGPDGRLAAVLLDQLAAAPIEKLNFPMPADPRLRKIAAAMMANPAGRATVDAWGKRMGIAPRTLTRVLQRETGMSFGRWRQQLHILLALQRLSQGASVQTVALDLGYVGASAFITMFRKALGKPPARYLADRRAEQ